MLRHLRIREGNSREDEQALESLKKAGSMVQDSVEVPYNMAAVYQAQGRYDEAITHCQKLLAVDAGFFDIVATMHDVISLGIGEPDAGTLALYSGSSFYCLDPNGSIGGRRLMAGQWAQITLRDARPARAAAAARRARPGNPRSWQGGEAERQCRGHRRGGYLDRKHGDHRPANRCGAGRYSIGSPDREHAHRLHRERQGEDAPEQNLPVRLDCDG